LYTISYTPNSVSEELSSNTFVAHLQANQRARENMDELEKYLSSPPVPEADPIGWWLEKPQQDAFPYLSKMLSRMALDLLSVPAMSADVEHLFSAAKITLTDRRNRMGMVLMEALECLKSWLGISSFEEELLYESDPNEESY
jgi:hypothetical protein